MVVNLLNSFEMSFGSRFTEGYLGFLQEGCWILVLVLVQLCGEKLICDHVYYVTSVVKIDIGLFLWCFFC